MTSWSRVEFLILVTFLNLTLMYDIMVTCWISYFSNISKNVALYYLSRATILQVHILADFENCGLAGTHFSGFEITCSIYLKLYNDINISRYNS